MKFQHPAPYSRARHSKLWGHSPPLPTHPASLSQVAKDEESSHRPINAPPSSSKPRTACDDTAGIASFRHRNKTRGRALLPTGSAAAAQRFTRGPTRLLTGEQRPRPPCPPPAGRTAPAPRSPAPPTHPGLPRVPPRGGGSPGHAAASRPAGQNDLRPEQRGGSPRRRQAEGKGQPPPRQYGQRAGVGAAGGGAEPAAALRCAALPSAPPPQRAHQPSVQLGLALASARREPGVLGIAQTLGGGRRSFHDGGEGATGRAEGQTASSGGLRQSSLRGRGQHRRVARPRRLAPEAASPLARARGRSGCPGGGAGGVRGAIGIGAGSGAPGEPGLAWPRRSARPRQLTPP